MAVLIRLGVLLISAGCLTFLLLSLSAERALPDDAPFPLESRAGLLVAPERESSEDPRVGRMMFFESFTTAEERAENREQVLRWQHAQRAKGLCRCGARIAPASKGRCWECLERCRRVQAARRGKPVTGWRRRGRPLLGSLGVRRPAFEREERRRTRVRQRAAQ
ncbi:MAG: hypothetical protein IH939_18185 [Acidobacteria bacterium]|nr:hypothetical protein [Acidobacteriota bacterium]